MDLQEYFKEHTGSGILATADADGNVDLAVYARPHVKDSGTVAFIMRDRLSHQNLQSNPHAAYIFIEEGQGYRGKRLYLTRSGEETDPERIEALRRRTKPDSHPDERKFLVTFSVDRVRQAVGTEDGGWDIDIMKIDALLHLNSPWKEVDGVFTMHHHLSPCFDRHYSSAKQGCYDIALADSDRHKPIPSPGVTEDRGVLSEQARS